MRLTTYTSQPPATARAARRAWDYFRDKYPTRSIKTLCYTPSYQGDYRGWIAEWDISPEKMDAILNCWGAAYETRWMYGVISCEALSRFTPTRATAIRASASTKGESNAL